MNQKGPVLWSNTSRTCKGQTEVFYPTLSAIDRASGIEQRGGMSIADGMTLYGGAHTAEEHRIVRGRHTVYGGLMDRRRVIVNRGPLLG